MIFSLAFSFFQISDLSRRWEDAIPKASAHVLQAVSEGEGPGISVAVGQGKHVIWAAGFGYADIENKLSVKPSSLFRVGSVSKTLTASALMRLWDQGKVDIDRSLRSYVPQWPEKHSSFSTRQVAGHLAGVRHYKGVEFLMNQSFPSISSSMEIFQDDPLGSVPGTTYSYSTYGWTLVSAVIEKVGEKPFLEVMYEEVLKPLKLENTIPDCVDEEILERVLFYQGRDSKFILTPEVDNSYKWSGGGYLSTPSDLVRFGLHHLEPGYLSKEALGQLHTSQRTVKGKKTNYGIGWKMGKHKRLGAWVGHSGGSIGGTTMFLLFPEKEISVAVAINNSDGPARSLAFLIAQEFFPVSQGDAPSTQMR